MQLYILLSFLVGAVWSAQYKCDLDDNKGGYHDCRYSCNSKSCDNAYCYVECTDYYPDGSSNYTYDYYRCDNGGTFKPKLPKCVRVKGTPPPTSTPTTKPTTTTKSTATTTTKKPGPTPTQGPYKCDLARNKGGEYDCDYYCTSKSCDNAYCYVKCTDYYPDGSSNYTYDYYRCENGGTFDPKLPKCVRVRGTPPPANAASGPAATTATATATATATGTTKKPKRKTCEIRLKKGATGQKNCMSNDNKNFTCYIRCDKGKTQKYTCLKGTFDPDLPSCVEQVSAQPQLKCDLEDNEGGYHDCEYYCNTKWCDNAYCYVKCTDYYPDGSSNYTYDYHRCESGGTFQPKLPKCVRVRGTPPQPSPGKSCDVRLRKGTQGQKSCSVDDNNKYTCRLRCAHDPYQTLTCENGKFNEKLPYCWEQV